VIVNERFRVEVAEDASFTIIDRVTDTRSARMNVLIDEGDRGDEYTYSYAGPTIGSKGVAGRRSTRVDGDRALVTVDIVLRLPASLRDDRLARRPDLVDERVRFVISLDASAAHVDVSATVTNAARRSARAAWPCRSRDRDAVGAVPRRADVPVLRRPARRGFRHPAGCARGARVPFTGLALVRIGRRALLLVPRRRPGGHALGRP